MRIRTYVCNGKWDIDEEYAKKVLKDENLTSEIMCLRQLFAADNPTLTKANIYDVVSWAINRKQFTYTFIHVSHLNIIHSYFRVLAKTHPITPCTGKTTIKMIVISESKNAVLMLMESRYTITNSGEKIYHELKDFRAGLAGGSVETSDPSLGYALAREAEEELCYFGTHGEDIPFNKFKHVVQFQTQTKFGRVIWYVGCIDEQLTAKFDALCGCDTLGSRKKYNKSPPVTYNDGEIYGINWVSIPLFCRAASNDERVKMFIKTPSVRTTRPISDMMQDYRSITHDTNIERDLVNFAVSSL